MISIDQLLESVDLDFEPRWVTKDKSGIISIWYDKPSISLASNAWIEQTEFVVIHLLKLANFENKDWTECIYEVLRKTSGKIEKLTGMLSTANGKRKIVFPSDVSQEDIISKLHEVIDAVNELKGAKNE